MLEVSDLAKTYGDHTVLKAVTFAVEPGAVTGFLGPNGAGKSTTLRIVLGLEQADHGSATFDEITFQKLPHPGRTVAAMLDPQWLPPNLTAKQHLHACSLVRGASKAAVNRALADVDLDQAAKTRIGRLSMGMRQRLGLATCLLTRPDYLILDEPINGLDVDGILWLRSLLRTIAGAGTGVLLSSHVMSEMQAVADRIVILRDGTVRACGPTSDILRGSQPRVRVRLSTEGVGALTYVLKERGATVDQPSPVELLVGSLPSREIFTLAADNGVVLDELYIERSTLEEAYLAVTNGVNA